MATWTIWLLWLNKKKSFKYLIKEVPDATKIEPRFKHAITFQTYEDSVVGESSISNKLHDPKPLSYQFTAEKGDKFGWK